MDSPQAKEAGVGASVTQQPGAAAFRCRAAEAALRRLPRISVESLLMPEPPQDPKNQPGLDELISLSQATKLSGLSPSHLRLLVTRGEMWGVKLGRNWFTTAQAIDEYLKQGRKPGPKAGVRRVK
jgi:hypothetical protein